MARTASVYRVAASCFEPEADMDLAQRREALRIHLDRLLRTQRPDLVVLPEVALTHGIGADRGWGAEPLDGQTVRLVAELAGAHTVNCCIPIIEDADGTLYNTAVYLDRQGQRAGVFRKQVPTGSETRGGIRPGAAEQPPVTLDGLRLGTAICFDENFPDLTWRWIEVGVDLLVFPAYTYAGELMRAWAVQCGVPLICAFPWESVIYDRDGTILAQSGTRTPTVSNGYHPPWICASLNLRSRVYHLDGNQTRIQDLSDRYGNQLDVQLLLREGRMRITAVDDALDLGEMEREFGIVPLQDYLRASRAMAEGRLPEALQYPTVQDYVRARTR